ncbi:MAG: hypothetical protein IPJ88_01850 [Myxococcales bacterium]|nr:MAG: hypothetical protein IPJ88_01850 [Myxococcales bacterium]
MKWCVCFVLVASCGLNPYLSSSCDDGVDNDGDGRTDNSDSECAAASEDSEIVCEAPQRLCGLYCVDVDVDVQHCGDCKRSCGIDQLCVDGQCNDSDAQSCVSAMVNQSTISQFSDVSPVVEIEQNFEICSAWRKYAASRFYQFPIRKNPTERVLVSTVTSNDQVLFFYSNCLPSPQFIGCLQVQQGEQRTRAKLPDDKARYSVLYIELHSDTAAQSPAPEIEIW